MDKLIKDAYSMAVSTNDTYSRHKARWEYLLQSYVGGEDYRQAGHLTKYQLETPSEYAARLRATPLDNHCRSVVSVYVSFLFRQTPQRTFGSIESDPALESFLKDCDYDGRSLDAFMKEVSIWSSVFGHCFIIMTKPNVGAQTRAEELSQGVRPYVSVLTPLVVTDWSWSRKPNGQYVLDYVKYIEDVNGDVHTVKEWDNEFIVTTIVDNKNRSVTNRSIEVNGLGTVPIVIAYNQRSPVRGLGISDINDIADHQKKIYNELSEVEQSIRLNGHPALVKTPSVEAVGGAGAVVSMPEDMDPQLKPYLLNVSTDIAQIYASISSSVDAIDKMANTGAVRATQSRTVSGVAMETEFQLLNAKLSEKADNLQLAEEQLWRLYAQYQSLAWDGDVVYPGSFNVRDTQSEISQLKIAKETATDARVLKEIDLDILEWMGVEEPNAVLAEPESEARTYENGEPIDARLPEAYRNATGESRQCENCAFYNAETFTCSAFGGAAVRPMWVCARWEDVQGE
jgi:hypothetical protein